MTLDELEQWLQKNPQVINRQRQRRSAIKLSELPLVPPQVYLEFLERFGPFCWFSHQCFLDIDDMLDRIEFIRDLPSSAEPEEAEVFELIPFYSLGYDNCYLCFQGESIIDFDPLDIRTFVAPSFEEFLCRYIEAEGQSFWLSG